MDKRFLLIFFLTLKCMRWSDGLLFGHADLEAATTLLRISLTLMILFPLWK